MPFRTCKRGMVRLNDREEKEQKVSLSLLSSSTNPFFVISVREKVVSINGLNCEEINGRDTHDVPIINDIKNRCKRFIADAWFLH